ncbi:VCBS repeat-containing protein [Streptomyces sp. SID3343]|uniref:FG-GAP repeat domain-containing protein n=1 Tax=Streptomyces sp. SID3343 TaxID=2690260 RepID=UPI00137218E3|nr:VCBS repeat-containing protein [Streptomyces sp. SID3343]MYV97399.1 hypothetical protein [Streptomyces sp. SID3343]
MGHPPLARTRKRLTVVACGLLGLVLAGGTTAANAAPKTPPVAAVKTAKSPPSQPSSPLSPEDAAVARAARTGQPVVVPELTTETDLVTARPDGTLGLKRSVEPSRTKKSGAWADLDPTLIAATDGTLRAKSTTADVAFSGGGTTPLAALDNGGRKLALTWPTPLPTPRLDGPSAVYPEVLPDVDLKVTATEQGGFTHILIVKTPQAASDPALADLRLGMNLDGVTVARDTTGSLKATTPEGKTAFTAPAPIMWDSRTTPAPAEAQAKGRAGVAGTASASSYAVADGDVVPADEVASTDERPGAHAATAPIETAVTADALTLTPDAGLLHAPDTVFPLYIDPAWVPMIDWAGIQTWAQEGYPDTAGVENTKFELGSGYQRWGTGNHGLERSYFQVGYNLNGRLDGKHILFVTFNVTQVYSAKRGCPDSNWPVYLHLTGDNIGNDTDWNHRPADKGRWGSNSFKGSDCGGDQNIEFGITDNLKPYPNWEVLTFGILGDESKTTANNGLKRYSRTASDTYLYVQYNTPPNKPANLNTTPSPSRLDADGPAAVKTWTDTGCAPAGGEGWIGATNGNTGVRMNATVSDADNHLVANKFSFVDDTTQTVILDEQHSPFVASGSAVSIATGPLTDGHRYGWYSRTSDNLDDSPFTAACYFRVDTTAPAGPQVTIAPGDAAKPTGAERTLTFQSSDGGSGLVAFEYAFNASMPVGGASLVTADAQGRAQLTLKPGMWGTNILRVQAVDRAGNRSQTLNHTFYVPDDPNAPTVAGDITGNGTPDVLVVDGNDLRMYPTDHGLLPRPQPEGSVVAGDGSVLASTGPNSPGQSTWAGSLVSHNTGPGIRTDELFAWQKGPQDNGTLRIYRSSLSLALPPAQRGLLNNDHQYFKRERSVVATVPRPGCTGDCAGYNALDWSSVKQILAVGDADKRTDEDGNGFGDLITIETDVTGNGSLWFFHRDPGGDFSEARMIGGLGWQGITLAAPGDINGDGLPDLWARYPSGALYQFPSRLLPDGTPDVAALGDAGAKSQIGTGYTPAAYPLLSTDGNITGDARPDLWTRTTDGSLLVHTGRAPAAGTTAFAPPIALTSSSTPTGTTTTFTDGTLVKGAGRAEVFVVNGGAGFHIPDEDTFFRLGYTFDRVLTVPAATVDALPHIPRDGTLLREEHEANVYLVRGGIRAAFTSEDQFFGLGYRWASIGIVPDHSLDPIPRGADL